MRLIDADALEYHKQLECMGNGQYENVKVVYEWEIDTAPTIDAEPVVRCKDCVHMEMMDKTLNDVRYVFCNKSKQHRFMPSDGYCSYGERREP